MGIKIAGWQEALIIKLKELDFEVGHPDQDGFTLIEFTDHGNLVLNLISIDQEIKPSDAVLLQAQYQQNNIQLVQLWEDVWLTRPEQVLSRICSMLGRNKKVHGRKTAIRTITQPEADDFLNRFHLQGSAKARHRYALEIDGVMVAVASFSGKRRMTRKHADYTSVELIRFATAEGVTVQGGLSKLVKHLIKTVKPNDVMTYADLDWSYGKGYAKLGFKFCEQMPPAEIWLDMKKLIRYFPHRLPDEVQEIALAAGNYDFTNGSSSVTDNSSAATAKMRSLNYVKVFNTGNLKYILYL